MFRSLSRAVFGCILAMILFNGYQTEARAFYANVEITVTTADNQQESKVNIIFVQDGAYKNTGFIGDKDGFTTMIQADENSDLRVVAFPKRVDGDCFWSADERFYFGLPGAFEETPVEANYIDMQIPSGGSFNIENQAKKSNKSRLFITKTYSGYGAANVTEIVLGDHQMNLNEINAITGDYLRNDSAVTDVDQTVEEYSNHPVSQDIEVGKMTERLIKGTATNTEDERIWNLENQLRIAREEREAIQNDYEQLRDALGTDGQINALNTHVNEVEARDQLLLNENAALSLAIQSKDNTIKALQDELDRIRADLEAAMANAYVPPEEESESDPQVFAVIREDPVIEETVVIEETPIIIPKPQKFYGLSKQTIVWLIVVCLLTCTIIGCIVYLRFTKHGQNTWYEIKRNTLWRL